MQGRFRSSSGTGGPAPIPVLVDRIARIIELERSADAKQKASDADRWEAARLIAEELDATDKTMRALAKEIGRSHTHVRKMVAVWRRRQHLRGRYTFHALYTTAINLEPPGERRLAHDDGPANRTIFGGPDDEEWKPVSTARPVQRVPREPEPDEYRPLDPKLRVGFFGALKGAYRTAKRVDPARLNDEDAAAAIRLIEPTIARLEELLRRLKERESSEEPQEAQPVRGVG